MADPTQEIERVFEPQDEAGFPAGMSPRQPIASGECLMKALREGGLGSQTSA